MKTDKNLNCIICGNNVYTELYDEIFQCTNCKHIFADWSLTLDELREVYSNSYFNGLEYLDYLGDRRVIEKNFRLRLATLETFMPLSETSLLEIGCAYGFFLNLVREKAAFHLGLDLNEDAVNWSLTQLGVNAVCANLLDYDFGKLRFNTVCMWDTIEHLTRPDLFLDAACSVLDKGGLLALTTGNIGSVIARIRGRKWRLIHPPTHLHYFSRSSINRLLVRHGLQVIHSESCGYYRSVEQILYSVLKVRHNLGSAYDRLIRLGIGDKSVYLNLFDIMFVIATKT